MTKRILAIVMLVLMLFAMGCGPTDKGPVGGNDNNSSNDNGDVKEINEADYFLYKGKIVSNENTRYIEVEIIDSQIAFGKYLVLVDAATVYQDSEGNEITRDDLKVDDVIEISFSGQVMMSLPPQIYAQKITLK